MTRRHTEVVLTARINGEVITRRVSARVSLADFIRHDLGLTGTHVGCEHGACGACTVRLNGDIVRSCLTLAVQADGQEVDTIEGVTRSGEISDLQTAFQRHNAAQCGFCTPAMLLTAAALLSHTAQPSRRQIREYLSGNYCRCTGYQAIVEAVSEVARERGGSREACCGV